MPDDYGVSSGFASGFDAFQQQMARRQQQQQWDLNFMNQTGQDPQQLLAARKLMQQPGFQMPQQPQQQQFPQQMTPPQQGFPQQQPGGFPQQPMHAPQMGMPGQQPPPQQQMQSQPMGAMGAPQGGSDMFAQFQNFMSQGRRKAEAGTQDVEAQARERNAQADWMERRPTTGAGGVPDRGSPEWNQLLQNVKDGKAVVDDYFKGMGQTTARRMFIEDLSKIAPDYNFGQAAASRGAQVAERKAPFSAGAYKTAQLAKSLQPQIDLTLQALDPVNNGDVRAINNIEQKLQIGLGTDAGDNFALLKDWTNGIADEFQAQIGSGSDAKLNLAQRMIDSAKNPTQLRNALHIISTISKSRAQAMSGHTPTTETVAPKPKSSKGGDTVDIIDSQGQTHKGLPRKNLAAARKRDPRLKVIGE